MSRGNTVEYLRVGDHLVRLERPAPTPQYDVYDVMGAAFMGAMLAILMLSLFLIGK